MIGNTGWVRVGTIEAATFLNVETGGTLKMKMIGHVNKKFRSNPLVVHCTEIHARPELLEWAGVPKGDKGRIISIPNKNLRLSLSESENKYIVEILVNNPEEFELLYGGSFEW